MTLEQHLNTYSEIDTSLFTSNNKSLRAEEGIKLSKFLIWVIDEYRKVYPNDVEGLELRIMDLILSKFHVTK